MRTQCGSGQIVPMLRVVTPLVTLRVTLWDAERPGLHSHAERGNDQVGVTALQQQRWKHGSL